MAKETTKALAAKHLQIPEFLGGMIDEVVVPGLREAAEKTNTPLDDMAVAALAPILADYIKGQVHRLYYQELLAPEAVITE